MAALLALLAAGCGGAVAPQDARGDGAPSDAGAADAAEDTATPVEPDVPVGPQPNGSPCARDSECISGLCVTTPGLGGGCAVPCTHDADCDPDTTALYCALEPATSGGRFACTTVDGALWFGGDECTRDSECVSNVCREGSCREACARDADCTAGTRCTMETINGRNVQVCGHAPITAPVVEDFTLVDESVAPDRGNERLLIVPSDAVSISVTAQDTEGRNLYASVARVTAPDTTMWIDSRTWSFVNEQPVREIIPILQVNTALMPSSDTLRVTGGRYTISSVLFNVSGAPTVARRHLRTVARVKRAPGGVLPASGTLHLRVYVVGVTGLTAASAPSNARLRTALDQMRRAYAAVGVDVVVDEYRDVTGTDAGTYSMIDTRDELDGLFALSAGATGDTVNIFLVQGLSDAGGFDNVLGIAGDIVGPAGVHGTSNSGVVVGWESTLGRSDLLGQVFAHETGHFLGLWHTRERVPGCVTETQQDCAPFGGVDPISDTPTDDGARGYLMYWSTASGTNVTISAGQGRVVRGSVLVR